MIEVDVGAAVDKGGRTIRKFTPDMIRRMDEPPEPINPSGSSSGWVSERHHSRRTIPERSFTSTPEFFNSEESHPMVMPMEGKTGLLKKKIAGR